MRAAPVLLLGALLLPPLLAGRAGAPGPLGLRLNLGPGDGPYLSGFASSYDIVDGVALQWSGPEAQIALPLRYSGPAALTLRFGPPRGGEARVDIALGGRPAASFECCRRPTFQRRRFPVLDGERTPVRLFLRTTAPRGGELGLLLDWVELEVGAGGRVVLEGAARWRPAVLVGAAFLLLLIGGLSLRVAVLACSPLALGLAVLLLRDPWLVHRLLTALPETLLAFGLVAVGLARVLERRGLLDPRSRRLGVALALLVFVARAAAVNHPDYYYPDLMSHARRTAVVQRAGHDAFLAPARYLEARAPSKAAGAGRTAAGLWLYPIGGEHFALPYSLVPYLPVAALRLDYDRTITALKLLGAACSALPLVLVAALARALSAPLSCLVLLAAAPTPMAELSFASMPALFGHAFDLALLAFLAFRLPQIERPRVFAAGTLLLAAAQLAYISSTVTTTILVGSLGLLALGEGAAGRPRARALLLLLLLGSGLSLLLYYRDFLPGTLEAVRAALASPTTARPARPGPGRIDLSLATWAFPLPLLLGLAGLPRLLRERTAPRAVLVATLLALGMVAAVRLRLPVVFGHVHLALLLTPLLCLAAAAGIEETARRGRRARILAAAGLVLVVSHGLWLQARLLADQLGRAR
jgi:hypothetical protein